MCVDYLHECGRSWNLAERSWGQLVGDHKLCALRLVNFVPAAKGVLLEHCSSRLRDILLGARWCVKLCEMFWSVYVAPFCDVRRFYLDVFPSSAFMLILSFLSFFLWFWNEKFLLYFS